MLLVKQSGNNNGYMKRYANLKVGNNACVMCQDSIGRQKRNLKRSGKLSKRGI